MPYISIVVPAYNNASLLISCLESISAQTFNNWETIIVNDASSDNTSTVAHERAASDDRFVVVDKTKNEGLHLARKTGVEKARGRFIMFLDADDALNGNDVLEALAREALYEPASIIRFGLVAQAEGGTSEDTARAFTAWSNRELPGTLTMADTLKNTFSPSHHWKLPWHVTHRLFDSELAKTAFGMMTNDRLERAEDAYEYLVLASLASDERSCCGIEGYLYHMGAGVTNAKELSADKFIRETEAIWACSVAAEEYAQSTGRNDLVEYARGLKAKLLESMGNDLNERVADAERPLAEQRFIDVVGPELAAIELWRFVRDKSWRYLVDDFVPGDDDELFREEAAARAIKLEEGAWRHHHNQKLAEQYLAQLRRRQAAEKSPSDIQIFASTHMHVTSFDSDILKLVQVGATRASERFWETLHDDDGENISELNPYYCELTTQYWAWKNVDADYYGFCHYRRYFDFSLERHRENNWGEIIDKRITKSAQHRYHLDDDKIRAAIDGFDIITTEFKNLKSYPGGASTPLEQWRESPQLIDRDFENMIAILLDRHPDYSEDVEAFLMGNRSCFCNMFVMRKKLFFDYCEWLFPLLDEFMSVTDFSTHSKEAARTPGHLSERLFNIYFLHNMRVGAGWKHREVQCVHFTEPHNTIKLSKPSEWNADFKPVIPLVFASDNNYVPMLTTTIYSTLKNASPAFHYDVIIMTTDITRENEEAMRRFLEPIAPATIRVLPVQSMIEDYDLTTNNPHIGIETYYRFLIQDALPHYDKVLYLDSDLIVQGDVSELYAVELGSNLLAAVRDVDYLGNLNMKDGQRLEYSRSVLGMKNPYDYFQAGVLVLNTKALRNEIPVKTWLNEASDDRYIYNDQDILNACCEGRVVFLDPSWNVMHNGWNRIGAVCSHAPAPIFEAYLEARQHEKIIHYAGSEKPWNKYDCDRMNEYWSYAKDTPFYEKLLAQFAHDCGGQIVQARQKGRDFQIVGDNSPIRAIVDPILPPGSERRETVRTIVKKVLPKH